MGEQNWLAEARELFQQGKSEAALEILKEKMQQEATFGVDEWELLGCVFQSLENSEGAAVSFDNCGNALSDLGRYEEAVTSHDRAVAINPDDYQAWSNRGNALSNLGRYEEAVTSHDRAIAINPDDYLAWDNRGNALSNLGRYEEAVTSHNRAIAINPDYYQAWDNRGIVLHCLGRCEEALTSHDQAIAIKPDHYRAWDNRGSALHCLGRCEEALTSHDQAIAIKPDHYRAWDNRGSALSRLDRHQEALTSYNQAITINSDDCLTWYNRGNALSDLGRYEEAVTSHDRAIAINPDYYLAWFNRATTICTWSIRQLSSTDFMSTIQKRSISALQQPEPHIAALQEALPHLAESSVSWAQIHLAIGDACLKHSRAQQNPSPYWRDAIRSYQAAYPILSAQKFPEDHLSVLQGLIRAHLAFEDIPNARTFQQEGQQLFEQLRAAKPKALKPTFEQKFASFTQLEIDLLIGDQKPTAALEQAEFYKNRCLTWILHDWQNSPESPSYAEIKALVKPQTAILYWHLSIDSLTTFILMAGQDEPIILSADRRKQAQRLQQWLSTYNSQYRSYANQKPKADKHLVNHPWRKSLENQLTKLREILQIDAISAQLPDTIQNLILVPHRDLHCVPLQALFTEQFTCTFLPSLHIGLRLEANQRSQEIIPLLNVDDPQTEQSEMPFARIESAVIQGLVKDATPIQGQNASLEKVTSELQKPYKAFHFTGHGAYNAQNPSASALGLADGLLTAKQIYQLNLSSYQLVCLAACETALTGKEGIPDEYVGLASAFVKAGAANVLSTLWPVDEIASAWMMIRFYQSLLAGQPPATALKTAQAWLQTVSHPALADWITQVSQLPELSPLTSDRLKARAQNTLEEGGTMEPTQPTQYAHPYYWAAFTLTGRG